MPTANLKDALSPVAAVGIPLAWGATAGVAAGLVGLSWAVAKQQPDPFAVAGVAGGLAFGAAWLRGLAWWGSLAREIVSGPQPQPAGEVYPTEVTRVALTIQDSSAPAFPHGHFFDLPISAEQMRAISAHLVRRGYDFSMASCAGRGKPLSRSEYESLRDCLIEFDLAAWNNPDARAQGVRLNGAGRAFVRKWAGLGNSYQVASSPTLQPAEFTGWLQSLSMAASARVRACDPGRSRAG